MTDRQPIELGLTHADGSLDLFGENVVDGVEFTVHALADGTDWGNPESVRRALRSAISQGSVSVTDRYDNRTIPLRVKVSAADGVALAVGEKALMLASGRRARLTWTPPADMAAPAVFVVVNSDLKFEFNDRRDHIERIYVLTLEALPFTRSVDEVTIEALPPFVAVPTVLKSMTSTTGWAGDAMTIAYASNVVTATSAALSPSTPGVTLGSIYPYTASFTPAVAIDMTKPYLALKGPTFPTRVRVASTFGGAMVTLERLGLDGAWAFYRAPANPHIAQFHFVGMLSIGGGATIVALDDIAETASPTASAVRQSVRMLDIPGSAPTSGSLLVQSRDGSPLGETCMYVGPSYDPRLSAGRKELDSTTPTVLSGGLAFNRTSFTFDRRISEIPFGSYALWGNPIPYDPVIGATLPTSLSWTITLSVVTEAGAIVVGNVASWSVVTPHPLGAGRQLLPMGVVDLPGLNIPSGSPYVLRFVAVSTTKASWDEGLIFNRDGNLTILAYAGGSKVWLESADLDHDARVLYGFGANTIADAVPVNKVDQLKTWPGTLTFNPGAQSIFVSTASEEDPKVSGTFPPAWHTHPLPLEPA